MGVISGVIQDTSGWHLDGDSYLDDSEATNVFSFMQSNTHGNTITFKVNQEDCWYIVVVAIRDI